MHLPLLILTTTSAAALASAQVVFNTTTDQFVCPSTPPNGSYCTSPSLISNIIIRCTGTEGQAGNCNDNLANVPPFGVKEFAPCYESSPTAADAACSYNGTVYPDNGAPSFPIPVPASNNDTTSANGKNHSSHVSIDISSALPLKAILTPITTGNSTIAPTRISALYPIPSANNATANATAAATATGSGSGIGIAPSKTGGKSAPAFVGAAACRSYVGGDVIAVAVAAVMGSMLLLL